MGSVSSESPLMQLTGVPDTGVVFHLGSFGLDPTASVYSALPVSGKIILSFFGEI